jgi:hypothetical protein
MPEYNTNSLAYRGQQFIKPIKFNRYRLEKPTEGALLTL